MNSIFGLMATSGGNFVSIAHLEIPLLIKMLMCQILIFPAVPGITLRRLLVTIELKSQPQYTQYLWVEIQRDRERAETPQVDLMRSLLN